ncbi:MAG: 2-oxo acid dehydrogenase subunit E2 [Candidatus Hydrogenedentota bacterium]|nr:MAG: 2-oxo acid dehydrogenase subunit E2 [Candidatus Hydrogenedentota bacterium]
MAKVVMPKLGLVMKEGLVVLWHKDEGERVEEGEDLLEIESDKVTTLIESPASGIVRKIIAVEGEVIPCGKTIAIIAEAGEEIPDLDEIVAETRAVALTREEWEERQALQEARSGSDEGDVGTEVKASPAARRVAKEHGIELSRIRGTGPEGRIVREDVLAAIEETKDVTETAVEGRPGESVPVGKMRRSIADNMARSARTVARVVHFAEVDMSRAVSYRDENRELFKRDAGADLSFNAILIKATASAMCEYPALNVSFQGDMIRKHADINIGLAVALDDGLITVSIKNADKKDLPAIATDSAALIEKARAGNLQVDDVTGSSITISNLGAFDIDCFAPVINLPEAAIIGVGSMVKRPVVKEDRIDAAPVMKLSLSFDHRLVDGAPAAKFLQILKRKLETMEIFD